MSAETSQPAAAPGEVVQSSPQQTQPIPSPGHNSQANVMAASKFSQQMIEQKERELHQSIATNYARLADVQRELRELQMQVKLTAEPKKQALELLRTKIETQNTKVVAVRQRHDAAKKVYEQLQSELAAEECAKQRLCDELNQLVTTSVSTQLERFEQLKVKLETLQQCGGGAGGGGHAAAAAEAGPGVVRGSAAPQQSLGAPAPAAAAAALGAGGDPGPDSSSKQQPDGGAGTQLAQGDALGRQDQQQQQQQQQPQLPVSTTAEAAAAAQAAAAVKAAAAAAAAARARHVQLPGRGMRHAGSTAAGAGADGSFKLHSSTSGGGGVALNSGVVPAPASNNTRQQETHGVQTDRNGRFAGFDA